MWPIEIPGHRFILQSSCPNRVGLYQLITFMIDSKGIQKYDTSGFDGLRSVLASKYYLWKIGVDIYVKLLLELRKKGTTYQGFNVHEALYRELDYVVGLNELTLTDSILSGRDLEGLLSALTSAAIKNHYEMFKKILWHLTQLKFTLYDGCYYGNGNKLIERLFWIIKPYTVDEAPWSSMSPMDIEEIAQPNDTESRRQMLVDFILTVKGLILDYKTRVFGYAIETCFRESVRINDNGLISMLWEEVKVEVVIRYAIQYGRVQVLQRALSSYLEYIFERERYDDLAQNCASAIYDHKKHGFGEEIFDIIFPYYYANRHCPKRHHLEHGMTTILIAAAGTDNSHMFTHVLFKIDDPMTINYAFTALAAYADNQPSIIPYWHRLYTLIVKGRARAVRYALVKAAVNCSVYAIKWLLPLVKNKRYIRYAMNAMKRYDLNRYYHSHQWYRDELLNMFNYRLAQI